MGTFQELKERRLVQIVVSYAAAGWIVLEVFSSLIENEVIPGIVYRVLLVWYLAGLVAALIIGWNHGEKGVQESPRSEKWSVFGLAVIAIFFSTRILMNAGGDAVASVDSRFDASRIAVLYLEDLSGDGELGYLADGLTEGLIDELSRVRTLDVISENGVAPFRDVRPAPYDNIAEVLSTGTIVDGSVEATGGGFRVSLRMVDGESGADIQRTSLTLDADRVLELQDSVATEVARSLRTWLGDEIELRRGQAETSSQVAWSLIQQAERARKQGGDLWRQGDADGAGAAFNRADSLSALAAEADPAWTQPPALRGWVAYLRARNALRDPIVAVGHVEEALGHAERALAVDSRSADALELRGTTNYWGWLLGMEDDPAAADELLASARSDLESAVELDPSRASAHSTLSHLYYQVDDVSGAVLSGRQAYEEDAYLDVADVILYRLFNGTYDLAQFNEADRWCSEGRQRFPDDYRFVECRLFLLAADDTNADVEAAWAEHATLVGITPEGARDFEDRLGRILVGAVLARAGMPDSANAVFEGSRAGASPDLDAELVGYEAAMRAITGDRDGAMDLLKLYVVGNPAHSFEVGGNLHWWWRSLADHPDFRAVRSRS